MAFKSECGIKRVIWKTWTGLSAGTLANSQTLIRRHRTRLRIKICTVCLSYRTLVVEPNSLKSPFRTIFPVYTPRQLTHQCCQCFDFLCFTFSFTTRGIHDMGSLSLAFWRSILLHEGNTLGNDVVCFRSDHHGFHRGTLRRHMPSTKGPQICQLIKEC